MKPWTSWLARLGLAGSCLLCVGCGGGDVPDPDSDANAASTPAPEGGAAPAPIAENPGAPAAPAAPGEAAPADADEAEAAAPAAEKAAANSLTGEMLALANAPAPSAEKASAEEAPAGGPPGMSSGAPGMPGVFQTGSAGGGAPAGMPGMPGGPGGAMAMPPGMQPGMPGAMAMPGSSSGMMPGMNGPGGLAGFPGAPGGDGGANAKPDFKTPESAVTSFLNALKSKDPDRLTEATARRAGQTAETSSHYQKTFQGIVEGSLAPEALDELAKKFEGFAIVSSNPPKSTGRFEVIIGKTGKNRGYLTRKITVRRELAGWKVVDIGGQREFQSPANSRIMPGAGRTTRSR